MMGPRADTSHCPLWGELRSVSLGWRHRYWHLLCREGAVQRRVAVWTESLSQTVRLDVVVETLRDLREADHRTPWVSCQH